MEKTFKITAGILAVVAIVTIVTLLIPAKPEQIEVDTETVQTVRAPLEETTDEETAAYTAATEPVSVDPVEETETETEVPSYSAEEIARYVLDNGINGPEREEFCGDRYEEVQEWINQNHVPPVQTYSEPSYSEPVYYGGGDVLTPSAGVCYFNGHMETYYNLPMGGVLDIMYSLGYSGDYWVRGDGCKMFGDYIMVAADFGWLPRGSVVLTSLGWGIVCDTGAGGSAWLDIATTW